MTNPWTTSRKELLTIAVDLVVNRGYTADGVAETMTNGHFYGSDRSRAYKRFLHDLLPMVTAGFRVKQEAEMNELRRMEAELIAEGWRWCAYQGDGVFVHESGWSVNPNGGVWPWKTAVVATYNSVTRASLKENQHV